MHTTRTVVIPVERLGDCARDCLLCEYEEHQRLRGQRLNKPTCMEERLRGMEDAQHDEERQKIEEGADRADIDHDVANEADIPTARRDNRAISTLSVGIVTWERS